MPNKPRTRTPNGELLEVAKDMQEAFDFMDGRVRHLTRFTTYRILRPPTVGQIRKLRTGLKLSQAGFARAINVGAKTVQSWEQGFRKPDGSAVALLWLLIEHQEPVLTWLTDKESKERSPVA
jgi:DNA-binding transcriptional regulator YiaG